MNSSAKLPPGCLKPIPVSFTEAPHAASLAAGARAGYAPPVPADAGPWQTRTFVLLLQNVS